MKPFSVYPLMDINIKRGQGSYVWDQNEQRYLDFYGGHAVISIGHGHTHFIKKINNQLSNLAFYSNSVENELQVELAKKIGEISGYPDYDLFMVNSGAEAVENALKLASFKNQRTKIIAFERGFHGRTSAAVNVTDNPKIIAKINQGFEVIKLPWNDLAGVKKQLVMNDVCSVLIEGIQGVGGIHVPDPDFLKEIEKLCQLTDTILIVDEIQSGYGRSGKFFAHQHAGIRPDLITIAKGMGNGFPIGGVLISPKFKAKFGLLGTTFGGTHLACSAGLAVVEVIQKEALIKNASLRGQQLIEAFKKIDEVLEIRGMGCMIGIDMPFPIKEFRKFLVKQFQIFTGSSSLPNTLRILPPLTVSESEIIEFIEKFKMALSLYQPKLVS